MVERLQNLHGSSMPGPQQYIPVGDLPCASRSPTLAPSIKIDSAGQCVGSKHRLEPHVRACQIYFSAKLFKYLGRYYRDSNLSVCGPLLLFLFVLCLFCYRYLPSATYLAWYIDARASTYPTSVNIITRAPAILYDVTSCFPTCPPATSLVFVFPFRPSDLVPAGWPDSGTEWIPTRPARPWSRPSSKVLSKALKKVRYRKVTIPQHSACERASRALAAAKSV